MPVTQRFWCADHIHLAKVDDDLVVLDVAADRYDCLLDIGEWVDVEPDGGLVIRDLGLARDLVIEKLVDDVPPSDGRKRIVGPDTETQASDHRLRWTTAPTAIGLAAASLDFRGRTLSSLLRRDRVEGSRSSRRPDFNARVAALASALPWIPGEGECLQRTFQLRAVLRRQGVATDWVFGVRTWPFAAHCWLQIETLVVADSLERVRRYTPILAY